MGRDWMQERESYRELILENIEYDYLIQSHQLDRDRLDELVELMVDTVCSRRETIRIAGDDYPAEVANRMLSQGIATLQENEHPVIHSDRGCHYQWPGWIELMSDAQLVRSMSRKGCSPDNSACEGFFGRLKNEMFYKKDWKGWSIEQFIEEVDTYIHWYNEKRIKMSLGGKSPLEFRKENFNNLMVV